MLTIFDWNTSLVSRMTYNFLTYYHCNCFILANYTYHLLIIRVIPDFTSFSNNHWIRKSKFIPLEPQWLAFPLRFGILSLPTCFEWSKPPRPNHTTSNKVAFLYAVPRNIVWLSFTFSRSSQARHLLIKRTLRPAGYLPSNWLPFPVLFHNVALSIIKLTA